MYKRARMGISYLSQEPSIFRRLTVEENIFGVLEFTDLAEREKKKRLEHLLEEFKIAHLRKQKAFTLSGGERRRVEIARSLVLSPKFMLLDEPFVGIDPIAVFDIQNIIKDLRKKNIGVLITDHNVRETLSITDRAYILYEGKILMSGPARKLIKDKKAKEIYLGEKFTL
jgi:lipopolysaccharide export system ATP-binding protein